jgi:hypothetical protein
LQLRLRLYFIILVIGISLRFLQFNSRITPEDICGKQKSFT